MSIAFLCDRCGQRYEVGDELGGRSVACKKCGVTLAIPEAMAPIDLVEVEPLPRKDNPYAAPRQGPRPVADGGDDAVSTIIPYKNAAALTAYYLGLFSCLPLLGLPMSIVALVLGVKGLKAVKRSPQVHGTAHAWVGLVFGTLGLLFNLFLAVVAVVGISGAAGRR